PVPDVSIIILSYHHPEVIDVCLRQLEKHTTWMGRDRYEVIVVDNTGPQARVPQVEYQLQRHKDEGRIDKLVFNDTNRFFSGGNNDGVAVSDPNSTYLLFMNSDVAPIDDEWLARMLEWIEGKAEHWPTVWGLNPAVPSDEPKDILSFGWRHD